MDPREEQKLLVKATAHLQKTLTMMRSARQSMRRLS